MTALIYQIFYAKKQRKYLDSGFIPLDVTHENCPKWCEYKVFRNHFSSSLPKETDLLGFISWKFFTKTHLRSSDLFSIFTANMGADVYFVNPYETSIAGLYKNVWTQLDAVYPGSLPIVQRCAQEAGYTVDLRSMVMPPYQMAYCNYWIATKPFWAEYMRFCEPMHDYLEFHLDAKTEKLFTEYDTKNHLGIFPHIMERMFSTFLHLQEGRWKVVPIPLPRTMLEINPEIITACNNAKANAIQNNLILPVLETQDVLLTHLMKYKQAAELVTSSDFAPANTLLRLLKRFR